MISPDDVQLFQYADDPGTALGLLQAAMAPEPEKKVPDIARSRTPHDPPP